MRLRGLFLLACPRHFLFVGFAPGLLHTLTRLAPSPLRVAHLRRADTLFSNTGVPASVEILNRITLCFVFVPC